MRELDAALLKLSAMSRVKKAISQDAVSVLERLAQEENTLARKMALARAAGD